VRERAGMQLKTRYDEATWSWLQFGCAFVLAAGLSFLRLRPGLDELVPHLLITLAIAGTCGALAGRFGDSAWHAIVKLLRWS
jgi:hypothetical protein